MVRSKRWSLFLFILCGLMLASCGKEEPPQIQEIEDIIVDPRENAVDKEVFFNRQSGFYDELQLEMFCPDEKATIYYTTDGTIPDRNSTKYEGPITLKDRTGSPEVLAARKDYCADSEYVPENRIVKGNIIRAIAYFEDGTASKVTNGTYIIGQKRFALYGNAPIISLITDPDNLLNEETGIFVLGKRYEEWLKEKPGNKDEPAWMVQGNFTNRGKEWERPVAFEYMPAGGYNVSYDLGLRTKGATTRTYLQKSMRLYAREEYGAKNIKAELIPGNMKSDGSGIISKYKTLVLRNGGNDNDFGKIRDPLIQALVADRNFDTQQSTPCVVFLNGEYWGLYAITEDYTDNYIETNYGIDKDNVVIIKKGKIEEGKDDDVSLYEDLYRFIVFNDMTETAYYEKAAGMIDIPSFLDYVALCLYVDNHDSLFDDNNWSLWRTRVADGKTDWSDGKWRFLIFDNEYSSGVYDGGTGFDVDTFSADLNSMSEDPYGYSTEYPLVNIFYSLYQNEEFKRDLILTLCDLRNYNFSAQNFKKVYDRIAPEYRLLAADSIYRFGPDWVVRWNDPAKYFEQKLNEVSKYFNGRYQAFNNIMNHAFAVGKPVTVTIKSDANMGDVRLNNTNLVFAELAKSTFSGEYFKAYPLTLVAKPKDGSRFLQWKVTGGTVLEENGTTLRIQPTKNCTIEAVYEKNDG